jgi:hypothetical protein
MNIQRNVNYWFEIWNAIMNIQARYFCLKPLPVTRFGDANRRQILKYKMQFMINAFP